MWRLNWMFVIVALPIVGCGPPPDQVVPRPTAGADQRTESTGTKLMPSQGEDQDRPWRADPSLHGQFHPLYPDDLQVIVHDGGPRLTKTTPEFMWVSVVGRSGRAYRGKLLNKPVHLATVREGEEILFVPGPKGIHPFRVTPKYLKEREHWHVLPCNKCGMPELFDAPSDLIAVIFPNLKERKDIEEMKFTSFCPLCGGVQIVSDKPLDEPE